MLHSLVDSALNSVRQIFFHFFIHILCNFKRFVYLCTAIQRNAQMAESVDALVSNTSGVKSIPVRPRVWVPQIPDSRKIIRGFSFYWAY